VFIAASTPQDKIDHIDATVRLVDGSREDVAAAAIERVETTGAFYASHVWNPWFLEGTKHYVHEIYDQLGGRLPGALVLPVGNGTLVLGAWRAMQELGVVVPIIGVQAEKCAPIAAAFAAEADEVTAVVDGGTVAAGIAIGAPVRGREILEAVRGSGGLLVTVTDEELLECAAELAAQGLEVEPTAAAPLAAARRLDDGDLVVPVASARPAKQEHGRSRTR
jgi:threonine synthase